MSNCERRRLSRNGRSHVWVAALAVFVAGTPLFACQVPVFRYALERWSADQYQVVVLHDGALDAPAKEAVALLRKAAESQPGRASPINLKLIDGKAGEIKGSQKDARLLSWWKKQTDRSRPKMLVFYPTANEVGRDAPAYEAPLTIGNVVSLLDSPVRQEIAKLLGQGQSAVWVFVPCGRKKDDQEALARLEEQIKADSKWIELPSAEELEVEPEVLEETKVPLRIEFSIVTLKRDDPKEQFLLQSLLHSEEDLTSFDQPLAFPVFGQGRVLYCLVGKGIGQDTVRAASSFMAGPCSCQVKNQNPGFDLLLQADWKKLLGDVLISEPIETPDRQALAPKLLAIPPGRK